MQAQNFNPVPYVTAITHLLIIVLLLTSEKAQIVIAGFLMVDTN